MFRYYRTRAVVLAGVVCTFVAWTAPGRSQQLERETADATEIHLLAQADTEATDTEATDTEATDTEATDTEAVSAITTEDPTIPVDQLQLLVKPLTVPELEVEAAAWRELVKAKVQEISNAEIAIKRKNVVLEREKTAVKALEDAKASLAAAKEAQTAATPGSPEAEAAAKKVEEAQKALATAQEAVDEATEVKQQLEGDEEVKKAVEEAEKDVQEGGKTAAEKEEEKQEELKEEAAAPKPDPYEFDLYCNQYGYQSYVGQSGEEISCTQQPEATDTQATEQTDRTDDQTEAAEDTINQAVSDIDSGAADSEQEAKLDEAAQQLQENQAAEEEVKTQLVVNVTTLQGQRTALIDRLNVVLTELETKGGDPAAYRSYVQAVSGVEIDVTDTQGLGVRAIAWLQSSEGGMRWGVNIGKFLGIVIVSAIAANVLGKIVNGTMSKFGASSLLREFVVMIIKRGGAVIGFLVALTALEISLGPVFAVLGGASFILAFALQNNLGNLASGLMIMAYKPFDVGDEVKISGVWGFIDSITLANTKILSWKKQIVIIPNNSVWGGQIENYTAGEIRAWSIKVNVPFDRDVETVQKIWKEIAGANPLVLEKPGPSAFPWAYDNYSVELYCGFKTKKDDFWTAYEQLFIAFQNRLKQEGINVAIPAQVEIKRTFEEFSHPLGLNKSNGTNGHQLETVASSRERDAETTGSLMEEEPEEPSID